MEFFSTPFYSHPSGYKMRIKVYANGDGNGKGTHVSVFTIILAGCYDNQLHWPFLGTMTYELLNQLGDKCHHSMKMTYDASDNMRVDGNGCGYFKFIPHSSLGHHQATKYLLDDTLYFRISVIVDNHKPWLVCTDFNSNNIIESTKEVTFEVTEYNKLKTRNMQAKSNSFYTSIEGYLMCILIDANSFGDDKDTHVSVFTQLLEGCYDNKLRWPFLGTVTYELLNQLGDNNHHSKVSTFTASHDMRVGGPGYGYNKYIPHSSLGHNPATNTQYLLDDTLYFRVSVKVNNHKPWQVCTQPINTES